MSPDLDLNICIWKCRCVLQRFVDSRNQKIIAERLGVAQPNLSRSLNPNNPVKLGTLVKWLKTLGVRVEFVVSGQ